MKREIKFRGRDICTGEWLYGDLRQRAGCLPSIIHSFCNRGKLDYCETPVHRNSVCQFTGLLDKSGKEIYEGDIVVWEKDERKYIVKFFDGMFYASVEEYNPGIYGGYPTLVLTHKEEGFGCEIVGNIHDNS